MVKIIKLKLEPIPDNQKTKKTNKVYKLWRPIYFTCIS